ncbi:MAG TPA: DUF1906 domain-containing protein [Rhizomicrobium sp.]|jgi:hypothetical protein|nr:DUF1906 domain-containing protein [Rhizomicrobium sp.]
MVNAPIGTVTTAAELNLRSGQPNSSAPLVGQIEKSSVLVVIATVQGQAINGNAQWYAGLNDIYFWSGACGALKSAPVLTAPAPPAASGALSGNVVAAPQGMLGFDCDFELTAQGVATYVSQGYKFCVRYITRAQPTEQPGDLTAAEANTILAGGLALMAVQHVAASPWTPSQSLGTQYGANAVSCAKEVGLPAGMNIWLDLEGVASGTPSQAVIDYCNAWVAPVVRAGYVPGLYVGANAILDSDELYWDLQFSHYWRSGSSVPDVAVRGYQLFQRIPPGDADIDQDVTKADNLGGTVLWLVRS